MSLLDLEHKLLSDLRALGIDVRGFELVLKPFSKSYYGRYVPRSKKIFLYAYEDSETTTMYRYSNLFKTLLHEVVHHIQWSDPDYVRIKGVMHNEEFYKIYNRLLAEHNRKVMSNRVKRFKSIRCEAC